MKRESIRQKREKAHTYILLSVMIFSEPAAGNNDTTNSNLTNISKIHLHENCQHILKLNARDARHEDTSSQSDTKNQ